MQSFRDVGIHRHGQAQSRWFSIRYQKIPHLVWRVRFFHGQTQLPVVSLQCWDGNRQLSCLITYCWQGLRVAKLTKGLTTSPANKACSKGAAQRSCPWPLLVHTHACPFPSFANIPHLHWRLCLVHKNDRSVICSSLVLVTTDHAKCLWIHILSVIAYWNTCHCAEEPISPSLHLPHL